MAFTTYQLTSYMQTISAAAALSVAAGTLVVLAALVSRNERILDMVRSWRTTIIFLVASGATAGSLYFSEVAGYVPCRFCWFQRIAIYPIAVLGLVAFLRRDSSVRFYAAPLAAIGACISAYHYLIEWRPALSTGSCSATGPSCTDIWFRSFGFLTLSGMALIAFCALLAVCLVPEAESD